LKKNKKDSGKSLKVIPLGGLQEIGKNITVFEYMDDIIIVDCGITFPEQDMLGIDIVIPNFTYLVNNKNKIRAIILTHGHEDHIGAVPFLLKQIRLDIPIYGTALTLGLLEYKLIDHKIYKKANLNVIKASDKVRIGVFNLQFINSNHSIADAIMVAIKTDIATILHTSDFKIDYNPIDGKPIDLNKISKLGEEGVTLLLADSTNAERKGYTMSESLVKEAFEDIFSKAKGRIIIATFASNVHRLQQIVNAAVKFNRKLAIFGRSMVNVTKKSMELGYLKIDEKIIVANNQLNSIQDNKLVLMTTGSQGEPMSALTRMAFSNHREVKIKEGDLVIISASVIPGNEKALFKVINELFKLGANVIYESLADIHVSGHACKEELKIIHELVKPKYFMPVHGEYRHLKHHANLALNRGMKKKNIFVLENGSVLEISKNKAIVNKKVHSGITLVDGLGIGDVGNAVLRDRKLLSQDGIITIVLTIDRTTNEIIAGPDIMSKGFIYAKHSEQLIENIKNIILDIVNENIKLTEDDIKRMIKRQLRNYLYEKIKRNPIIIPIIMIV